MDTNIVNKIDFKHYFHQLRSSSPKKICNIEGQVYEIKSIVLYEYVILRTMFKTTYLH